MTFRWAIAGTGRIASDFARDLGNVADAELVTVGSRNLESARTFADRHGIGRAHGSMDDLAADADVDVVYVAGIHPVHCDQAISMMEAGKHVLVEKPLAMNADEVDRMVAVSRRTGRFLMEAMWTRFNPMHVELKRRFDSGEFGRVTALESDFSFDAGGDPSHRLFDPTKGGGAMLDVGIYPISLAWWWLGRPASWEARGTVGPTGVDVDAAMELHWEGGVTAHLTCGSLRAGSATSVITCENAVITIPAKSHSSPVADIRTEAGTERLECDPPGLHHQVHEVHRCISDGANESPRMSHADSRAISAFMDAVLDVIHAR